MKCNDCGNLVWGNDDGEIVYGWCRVRQYCPDLGIERDCSSFLKKRPDALSTLQIENEKLRDELERCKEKNAGLALALLTECAPNPDCLGNDEWRAIRAELEQVKRERDEAIKTIFQWVGCPECKWWDSADEWCEKYDREADSCGGCESPEWRGQEEANMDKPRICEVLGVEVNENFKFNDFPFDECKVYFVGTDGEIRNAKGGSVTGGELCYIINHPDCIIRKPRWTEQEVERAKAIKVLYPEADHLDECDPQIKVLNTSFVIATLDNALFTSLRPGETIKLDEIIGGTE